MINKTIKLYIIIIIIKKKHLLCNMKNIYLTRHGESEYNLLNKIGGNSNLSEKGKLYSKKLGNYINNLQLNTPVYTSTLIRTINTGKYIKLDKIKLPILNEINAGICEHLTYSQIRDKYPEEYYKRKIDKLNYRYFQGESYKDLIHRLKPIIDIIENNDIILIIAHQAILRVIYGILTHKKESEYPNLDIQLHTLINLKINNEKIIENKIKLI